MFRTTRILTLLLFFAVPIGFASSALAGPAGPVCGNNDVEDGETCDDGNTIGGDGCSSTCQTEECGNEILDPGEECDDGNLNNGDGCSDQCLFEECGNAIIDPGEECDDGNTANGDGCDDECQDEPEPACGDGNLDDGEQCDDGNTVGGDGCAADCTIEGDDPFCGDGNLDDGEGCDDGNNDSGDGCNSECMVEACGNGVLDDGEECDDGNDADGDGCSANCTIEEVDPICGNEVVEGDEECDDGNLVDGDGCSANCTIEEVDAFCGDGNVDEGEECDDGNSEDGDGCSSDCTIEEGDGQNPGQKLCINTMNKRLKDTSKTQSKVALDCFESASPDACLTADEDGRVAKERAKTQTAKEKKCDPGNLPDFGFIGSTATHAAGTGASLAHVDDLFGSLDEAISEETVKCQEKVTYQSQDALEKLFKLAGKGKRRSLDAGASSGLELQNDIVALINSDDGKFDRYAHRKVGKAVEEDCKDVDLDKAFPGCAPKVPAAALARGLEVDPMPKEGVTKCAVDSARCRWCEAYNAADDLTIDCDEFDDGSKNGSCSEKDVPDEGDDDKGDDSCEDDGDCDVDSICIEGFCFLD